MIKNTVLNYILRVFIYLFNFLSVPLSLNFLGQERYGLFETILTALSWASLTNLGLGNGLRNNISYSLAENKTREIRHMIGATFTLSTVLVITLLLIGNICIYYLIDFTWLFTNITISITEIKISFSISFSFFCFSLFSELFSSIALGIHKSYISSLSKTLSSALYVLFLFWIVKAQIQSCLLISSIIYGIAILMGDFISAIFIFLRKDIWPPIFKKNGEYYKRLFKTSFSFFLLQIATIVLFSSDNFIISKLLGPKDVTEYSIINKCFFVIISLFSIVLIQVWNAAADAYVKQDFDWIRRIIKKLHLLLLSCIFMSFFIACFFNEIVSFWLGDEFSYSLLIRFLFVLYVYIHCSNAIYVNVLNGIGHLKWQIIVYLLCAVLNFLLSYYLIEYFDIGYIGVLYSKLFCVFLTSFVCMTDYYVFVKSKK